MEALAAACQSRTYCGTYMVCNAERNYNQRRRRSASATTLAQAHTATFLSEGGLVTGPGTGTSDSIPAMLSNGEAVMTAQAVNDWGAMLSAMNVASGGNAIQVSNLPQRNDGMKRDESDDP